MEVGDQVASRSPETGVSRSRKVVRTFRRTATQLVTVELADPSSGQVVERLTGTPEHPLFLEGGGLAPMGALGIGTSIVTRAGPALVVTSVRWENHPAGVLVYNFEVEEDHTYFVGKALGGAWVHNTCPRTFPNTPEEMDDMMGFPGTRQPDHELGDPSKKLPGRDRVDWDVSIPDSDKPMRITYEQHPYDLDSTDLHRQPHWHMDVPGMPPPPGKKKGSHYTYLPGDPLPGQ